MSNSRSVGWPSGLRRQFKALVSSEAWVRIPLQSLFENQKSFWFFSHAGFCTLRTKLKAAIPYSLVGQDTWFSPTRPGFDSRWGNTFLWIFFAKVVRVRLSLRAEIVPDSLGG